MWSKFIHENNFNFKPAVASFFLFVYEKTSQSNTLFHLETKKKK